MHISTLSVEIINQDYALLLIPDEIFYPITLSQPASNESTAFPLSIHTFLSISPVFEGPTAEQILQD